LLAFDSTVVRTMLKRYPQGRIRVKQIVLRRLWRNSISKASLKHAIRALKNASVEQDIAHSGNVSESCYSCLVKMNLAPFRSLS